MVIVLSDPCHGTMHIEVVLVHDYHDHIVESIPSRLLYVVGIYILVHGMRIECRTTKMLELTFAMQIISFAHNLRCVKDR